MALLSAQNSTVRWLDAQMFRLASNLLPVQPAANDFRVIQLDEGRLQEPQGIREFRFLLRKLKKADAAEIVWLSDDFPQMDYVPVEEEKTKASGKPAVVTAENDELEPQWLPTEGERNKLAWMLENQQVFLTQYGNTPKRQKNIAYTESLVYQKGWRQYIPSIFLPEVQTFRVTNTQLPYRVYPFNSGATDEQALVWYNEDKSFTLPDLSLAVFSRYQKSSLLHWDESGLVRFDSAQIPVNLSGKVFSYFSTLTGRHTDIKAQSLEAAAAESSD